MRSTFGGLNTMVRGLYSQQIALDTVGHNITNQNTPGYSRQLVSLAATNPQSYYSSLAKYEIGSGVEVQAIKRARDTFVDQQFWKESSSLTYGLKMEEMLGKIEGVFNEPTENGIQSVLNKFWSSLQTLAVNASDSGARTAVRERGVEMVNAVQHATQQLKDMVADVNSVLDIKLASINQMTSEILSLNKQIVDIEAPGSHANDLRDRRDYLVDQISQIAGITVSEDKLGNYTVQLNGVTLVDGHSTTRLGTRSSKDADYGYEVKHIVIADTNQPVNVLNGELKGLLESRDSELTGAKGYLNKLSDISQFLLQDFNAVHRNGYGTDNSTGINFFGNEKTTVGTTVTDANYASLAVSSTFTKGDWIKQLAVNDGLFEKDGLTKIAAKTNLGATVAMVPTGKATLANPQSGSYTGTTATTVTVKIGSAGNLRFSTDGGATWSAPLAGKVATANISGLDIDLDFSDALIGSEYEFKLDAASVGSIKQTINPVAGITQTGSYTGGAIATIVEIENTGANTFKYLVDGVWSTATYGSAFTIKGVDITIPIPTTPLANGDTFKFTVSEGSNASGDNAVLLANRLKVDTSGTLGHASLDGFYSSMIGTLGIQKQNIGRLAENQTALILQIDNWRESVKGVNQDEELSNMIRFQQGYNACSRVITTIDEMLDKLINSTGVVGR